jgi:hypothetical protein
MRQQNTSLSFLACYVDSICRLDLELPYFILYAFLFCCVLWESERERDGETLEDAGEGGGGGE